MSVTGDTIIEQVEMSYDDASNVIQMAICQRCHNAPASQTGELKNPSETPKARVTYAASYPDSLGRSQAAVNYGTNGASVAEVVRLQSRRTHTSPATPEPTSDEQQAGFSEVRLS
jgi:hypothetical protein